MNRFFEGTIICLIGIIVIALGRYTYVRIEYPKLVAEMEQQRRTFAREYTSAQSGRERAAVVSQARKYLHQVLSREVFPYWYGTPWGFYGNVESPLEGRIACGAFVENVLRNCGLVLHRRLSAQPSEYIIKNLVRNGNHIKRFSNASIESFVASVKEMGDGIYIVGLDSHVGFLYILAGKHRFVHSHGYLCVLPEYPLYSLSLRRSKYRVAGKLFDRPMIEKWLLKRRFNLKYDYFKKSTK